MLRCISSRYSCPHITNGQLAMCRFVSIEQLVSATGYFGESQVNCSSIFRRRGRILDEPICSLVDRRRFYKSFCEAAAQDIPIFSDCLPFRALLEWRILFSRGSSIEIESFSCWQLLLSGMCLCSLVCASAVWYVPLLSKHVYNIIGE